MSEIDVIDGGATTRSAKKKRVIKDIPAPKKLTGKDKVIASALNARLLPNFNARKLSEAQIKHIVSRAHGGARRAAIEAAQEVLKYPKGKIQKVHADFVTWKKAQKGKIVTEHVLANRLARDALRMKQNGIGMVAMMSAEAAAKYSRFKHKSARTAAAMKAAGPMERRAILFYEAAAQRAALSRNHKDLVASKSARKSLEESRSAAAALFKRGTKKEIAFAAELDRVKRVRDQHRFDAQERRKRATKAREDREKKRKAKIAERKKKKDAAKKKKDAAKKKKDAAKKKKAAAKKKKAAAKKKKRKAPAKKKKAPAKKKKLKKD